MVGAQGTGYKGGLQAETGGGAGVGKTKRSGSGTGVGKTGVGGMLESSLWLGINTAVVVAVRVEAGWITDPVTEGVTEIFFSNAGRVTIGWQAANRMIIKLKKTRPIQFPGKNLSISHGVTVGVTVLTSSAGMRVAEGVGVRVRTDWPVGLGMEVRG